MADEHNANPTLAEQAMTIYDEHGEDEMLSFVQLRLDTRPAGHEKNTKSLIVMEDHSALMITMDRYFFLWTPSEEQSKHPLAATRTRTSDKRVPHNANSRPVNIAGAVTRDTVLYEALKWVETDARLSLGQHANGNWVANDPPISEEKAQAIAPTLMEQIGRETSAGIEQDNIYQIMDDVAREMAQDALKAMNQDEHTALEAEMVRVVEEQEG